MTWTKYFSAVIIFSSLSLPLSAIKKNEIKTKSANAGVIKSIPTGTLPKLFEKILTLNSARIGNSAQIVLVTNEYLSSKVATIQTFEKVNGKWVVKNTNINATVGYKGFAPYKEKQEGDHKTPTGIYYLGPVYSYPEAKVSTKMEYWVASKNDYWIDDANSAQYNRWVTSNIDLIAKYKKKEEFSGERMHRDDDKYKYGIAVQYNMDQVKGKGSVITVHILIAGAATEGCIAIPEAKLISIIGWLDPVKKPLIITGTEEELINNPISETALDNNDKYIWKKEKYQPKLK